MPDICPVCSKNWRPGQNSIQCTTCHGWVHHNNRNNCSGLTDTEFLYHCDNNDKSWRCDKCFSEARLTLPFACLEDHDWLNYNELKPSDVKILDSKDCDFVLKCDSINSYLNMENDNDCEELTSINSKYYSIDQFNSLKLDVPSSFGLFHVNIASLQKHFDELKYVLSRVNYNFDVIVIS